MLSLFCNEPERDDIFGRSLDDDPVRSFRARGRQSEPGHQRSVGFSDDKNDPVGGDDPRGRIGDLDLL